MSAFFEQLRLLIQGWAGAGYLPEALAYGFVVNALFAGLLIGPVLGGLGTLVVVKRFAFFSEAVGHAALTGVAIGILLGEPYTGPYGSLFGYCLLFGLLLNYLRNRTGLSPDTLIGVFLSVSLAVGTDSHLLYLARYLSAYRPGTAGAVRCIDHHHGWHRLRRCRYRPQLVAKSQRESGMNKVFVNLTAAIGALLVASMTAAGEPVRVLASLPITYGLGSILLQGAEAQVVRAAPANLPASRQVSFFTGRGAGALEKAASSADAVIAVRSLWPEDPLYPMARRSNIRIVEIDAARPVDGALPGIALTSAGSNALEERPWLSINNLGRMADVIAADLMRLSPNDAKQIASNLADIKQRLLSLSAASESRLAELDSLSVISLSPGFEYLTSSLNLDVIEVLPPSTSDSDADASLESFKSAIRDNEVRLVLTSRPVKKGVANAAEDAGARLLILGELPEDPLRAISEITEQVIDGLADQQTY